MAISMWADRGKRSEIYLKELVHAVFGNLALTNWF